MKKAIIIALLLSTTRTAHADQRSAVLAQLSRREPSLDEVKRAALRHAGLDQRREAGWARRARLSGLLPVVTAAADHDSGRDRDLSRSSNGTERLDLGSERDLQIELRAVWHLERLMFSDLELRAHRAAEQRARERTQLLTQVTSLYFQRRKLQIEALWQPPDSDARAALNQLAIDEFSAQLDTLTGGYFSRTLAARARR
ncbi:MAG: hypothetical protein AAGC55_15000 [Myxococcota bacterium]